MNSSKTTQPSNDTHHDERNLHVHSSIHAGGWSNHSEEMAHLHTSIDVEDLTDASTVRVRSGIASGGWQNHNEASLRRSAR
jgi:hypothetical protein